MSVQLTVTTLQAIQADYAAQLLADAQSTTPQPSYSLDGEQVSRQEWRAGITKMIADLQELILMYQPYEIRTVGI